MLRAIRELGASPIAAVTERQAWARTAPEPALKDTAERREVTAAPARETAGGRRHVTVMFCDLVDSTGIAVRLDAEEWRDLVGAYLDAASAAVVEIGGTVAKKLGGGQMTLVGSPVAQENDAERAVRASLSIQRALAELNRNNEGTGKPCGSISASSSAHAGPHPPDARGRPASKAFLALDPNHPTPQVSNIAQSY
jgi:class 3 adenylate cyclase